MKKIIIIAFLSLNAFSSEAQNNTMATEAKAAYLLAEEQFAASNYPSALNYLETAVAKLGGANSKILYLRIMAQRELSRTDKSYLGKLDSSITDFEKAPDVAQFNEEKFLEVVKIKLALQNELATFRQNELNRINGEAALEKIGLPDWPFGATLTDLRQKHPEILKKENFFYRIPGTNISVLFMNKRLVSYSESKYIFNDDAAYSKGKAEFDIVLQRLKQQFTYLPTPQVTKYNDKGVDVQVSTYVWESPKKEVTLTLNLTSTPAQNPQSNWVLRVKDKTVK